MYGYLYCENRGSELLLDDVRFIPNLNINVENLPFFMFLKPYRMPPLVLAYTSFKVAYVGRGLSPLVSRGGLLPQTSLGGLHLLLSLSLSLLVLVRLLSRGDLCWINTYAAEN